MKKITILLAFLLLIVGSLYGNDFYEEKTNKNLIFLKDKSDIEYEILIEDNKVERIDFINVPYKTNWNNKVETIHTDLRVRPAYEITRNPDINRMIDIVQVKNKTIYIEHLFIEGLGYGLTDSNYNQIETIINNKIGSIFTYLYKIKALK